MRKIIMMFILFYFAASVVASADLIEYADGQGNGWQIDAFEPIGQSFTAEDSLVSTIGFQIFDVNEFVAPIDYVLDISLYSGDGDFSSTALILTQQVTMLPGLPWTNQWADIDVSSFVFDIGTMYTFAIYNDNARWGMYSNGTTNTYSGGSAYVQGNSRAYEMNFHVIPTAEGQPVPEPSTIALLGIGIVGLVGAGARRRKLNKKADVKS